MQIHELNKLKNCQEQTNEGLGDLAGPNGLIDKLKTGYKTLKNNSGSAEKLRQAATMNTFDAMHSDWAEMYQRTKSDIATQKWINGLNKLWQTQAGVNMSMQRTPTAKQPATTPTPKTTPTPIDTPLSIGGKKLDPKNPADARVIAQLKQQGKLTEAAQPFDQERFVAWTDQRLKSDYATMDEVRKDPRIKSSLDQALQKLSQSQGTQDWDLAFNNYMNIATTGIRTLTMAKKSQAQTQQASGTGTSAPQRTAGGPLPRNVTALLRTMGVEDPNADDVSRLKQYLQRDGIKSSVGSTGSPSLDALLQLMGHL